MAPPLPDALSRPVKHSLTVAGHRTSVTLEPLFWDAFRALAKRHGQSINALATEIDAARGLDLGLASAIRVHVLADLQAQLSQATSATHPTRKSDG